MNNKDDFLSAGHGDHAEGLGADLRRMAELERRRRALHTLAGLGALAALPSVGLARPASAPAGTRVIAPAGGRLLATQAASCTAIESETAGPYPADGTNGNGHGTIDVLTQTGIVRGDIRGSFGTMTGTATGVPLSVQLQLVSASGGCASLAGYAIYIWHCDSDGLYSLYTLPAQNYLRGVQETDSNGKVVFTSIFPGCYSGRWPHIHIEVYRSLAVATQGTNSLKTTQMALLRSACNKVYTKSDDYPGSSANLAKVSLSSDMVFGDDDAAHEQPVMSGSVAKGFTASLVVGI